MYTQGTKYENSEYLNLFKIPKEYISSFLSPGSTNQALKNVFDDNYLTYWISPEEGKKVKDPTTGIIYDPLKINITISFVKKVFIKSMIYQAFSSGNNLGIGYPEELNLYYSLETGNNAKFRLVDYTKSVATDKKVAFIFSKTIECKQINLEWKTIHSTSSYKNRATAKEIIFLYPETSNINNTIVNAFDKNDYKELTLDKNFNKNDINNMIKDLSLYGYNSYMKNRIQRILDILNGVLTYNSKREFSTVLNSGIGNIYQRGDIEKYARNVLKMQWAGTNRQGTGIYGLANENITVYVKATKSTDPLPQIQFSQYIGKSGNWLSKRIQLKIGKQILTVNDFKLENNLEKPTFPGGPIYLVNPYNSSQQSQVSIYIEGGKVFPTFKKGENEIEYKEKLLECINLNKKNNKTYFDITELYGIRVMITVRASDAYKIYSNKYSTSPNYNLIYWDNYLKELFTFDGVKYSVTSQYYNRINNFINIHYRYAQPHALAYASTEHVGIFTDNYFERALNFSIKKIGWGFSHETGHMMDIREREFPEITNNMVSKYYDAVICGNNTAGINDHQKNKIKYMTENNIDEKTRGCELVNNKDCMGFLKNSKLNYLIWWDLESIHHGYWGELDNMYRYNNTLPSRITKEEKMVYFSSIIFGMNLGYYFTRWD